MDLSRGFNPTLILAPGVLLAAFNIGLWLMSIFVSPNSDPGPEFYSFMLKWLMPYSLIALIIIFIGGKLQARIYLTDEYISKKKIFGEVRLFWKDVTSLRSQGWMIFIISDGHSKIRISLLLFHHPEEIYCVLGDRLPSRFVRS